MAGEAGRLIALAAVAAACGAAAAYDPVKALAGRYSERFDNALVTGETYTSENIVEIVPVDTGHAYVRFELQFFNGHMCTLFGVAEAQGNALVYREPADRTLDGDARCTLTVRRNGSQLAWNDDGSCKMYCGARGSFLSDGIAWSSKRPIHYLARLRRSDEYRGALTEWRTGRAAR